jgi:poly(3-hydroxyalkanoate) synthetase
MFDAPPVISLARFRSRRAGVLDGRSLGSVFTWLRPNDLVWNYWVNNYLLGNDPPTFDILAWNADGSADLWLKGAQKQPGTWWEHWAAWVLDRSGDERKAPSRLGNRRHPIVEDAPGSYVRGLEPALG